MANIAGARTARLVRERRTWRLWSAGRSEQSETPDTDAAVDLRQAMLRLPARKRACVVLRYYYGLSERETAETLGIAVGTVKSQTSRGWKNSQPNCVDRAPPTAPRPVRTGGPPLKERPDESDEP